MTKSQSPLIGSNQRRYRRHRPGHSSTFRNFRSAFTGRGAVPSVNNGPYRKDGTKSSSAPEQLFHLSKTAVLAGLVAVLVVVAAWRGWQFLENSAAFRVRQITVQGCRAAHKEQLLTLAELRQGMPLFGFNVLETEQRVRQHPWVDGVSIRRIWPDSVVIEVQERRPLAMINLAGALHYVDQSGLVFAPVAPGQDLDFPVIMGISPPETPQAFNLAEKGAEEAVQFLRLVAQGHPILPMQALSEIHVSGERGIVAYLAERPFPIYIGYGNIKTRYYQLVRLLERLYRKEKIEHIREIRMDYQPDRILVARVEP